jgi:hypothetical protein
LKQEVHRVQSVYFQEKQDFIKLLNKTNMHQTIKTMSNTRLFREWLTQGAKLRNHNKGYLTILTECTKLIKTAIEREMDARQMNWRILNSQKTILITFSEN